MAPSSFEIYPSVDENYIFALPPPELKI